ncbi:MAG: pyruvate kinase [Myxococcales bacterium]|nr:pyruvate kinase [Myxococcales bacterium]
MSADHHARRTKLVCTIGPASSSPEILEALIRAGLDVARLNFSHGTHEQHAETYRLIREAEAKVGRPVAIMQDLQGPKIRLGKLDGVVSLPEGEEVVLSSLNDFVGTRERLPTTYPQLARDVRVGESVLLADGRLVVEVTKVLSDEVHGRMVVGGEVTSNKGINLPGSETSVPSLTEKDRVDLEFGLKIGVDYVALSFVRLPNDVKVLREAMARHGRVVPVISKIEKPQAVEYLEAIVEVSDGVMVARGDLGVELPPEKVPPIQRRCLRLARAKAKIAVVATQMLVSMTKNPRPTHAEVSDVANAVFDGADAIMLSEETAAGSFPVKTVETMAALALAAEESASHEQRHDPSIFAEEVQADHAWAISRAAVITAEEVGAKAIVSLTQRGLGPRLIAAWRPRGMILGGAHTDEELRRMTFYWGVRPFRVGSPSSIEGLVSAVENSVLDSGLLSSGDTIIITSKMPFAEGIRTNMLKVHTLAE